LTSFFQTRLENSPELYATLGLDWRLTETGEVYWRGPNHSCHYRFDGPIDDTKIFSVSMFGTLLGLVLSVTTTEAKGGKTVVVGKAVFCKVGPCFEWLVLEHEGELRELRIDKIVKVDLLEG